MRLTVGQLRELLSEAKREDKRLKLLAHGAAHMMNVKARRRFDAFVAEITSELVGPGKRCYVYTKNTGTNHTFDLRIDSSDYSTPTGVWQLKAQANLRDPMRPLILVRNAPPRWAPDQTLPESVRLTIQEQFEAAMMPMPVSSGAWWADENLYAIRPIYDGEELDKPPVAEWCALDPTTHEPIVVKEAAQRHALREASTDDAHFYDNRTVPGIVTAAIVRMQEWLADEVSRDRVLSVKPGNVLSNSFSFYVTSAPKCPRVFVLVQFVATNRAKGTTLPNGCTSIYVDVSVSVPYLDDLKYEDVKYDGDFTDEGIEKMDAFLQEMKSETDIQPAESGEWWADENYYTIRPVMAGEGTKHKPAPTWTVVDGSTGNVVGEARSRSTDASASRKLNRNNRYSVMKELQHTSSATIRELLKDPWYSKRFENVKIEVKSIAGAKRLLVSFWRQGMTSGATAWASHDTVRKLTMMASLSDPMNVKVDMPRAWYRRMVSRGYPDWESDYERVKTDIRTACVPEADGKVWWADENMYLIRPLLKGEHPVYRPEPTWILVDSETHEEVPTKFVDDDAFRFHF